MLARVIYTRILVAHTDLSSNNNTATMVGDHYSRSRQREGRERERKSERGAKRERYSSPDDSVSLDVSSQ